LQSHLLPHDWVYDGTYYGEAVETPATKAAAVISASIVQDLNPSKVADVGCGTGAMLEALQTRGCSVQGFEKSKAALEICHARKLQVKEFDLENDDMPIERMFDVVISMEVAEHLPQKVDDRYIDMLTHLAPIVVFTAAPPGQGGTDHINEQPPEYWLEKFRRRNFQLDGSLTNSWRKSWGQSGQVKSWYFANLMIFRKLNT
jgi:SAM-dependent methyltransferase